MTVRIRPVAELGRLPEHGRIRIGVPDRNRGMRAIDTFRLTSADRAAIEEAAARYGGTPRPWSEGPRAGEWDLITTVTELPIALPPNPLGDTPIYESWKAGGCQRRCDGVECQLPVPTPDGMDWISQPCVCRADNLMLCKPKTRLVVILRELRFGGGWRFETGSWTAAEEMPGMVGAIEAMQVRGLSVGLLALQNAERKGEVMDKHGNVKVVTKKFKVVRLRMEASVNQLAAGIGTSAMIEVGAEGTRLALNGGSAPTEPAYFDPVDASPGPLPTWPRAEDDDEIIEAELVLDDELGLHPTEAVRQEGEHTGVHGTHGKLMARLRELVTAAGLEEGDLERIRHELVDQQTRGRTSSSLQLSEEEKLTLIDRMERALAGELMFGIKDGKARIGARPQEG